MSFPVQPLLATTQAKSLVELQLIQPLWNQYGGLYRAHLDDGRSVIAKWVVPPADQGGLGHRRKLRSYQVELNWYRHHAGHCGEVSRVPAYLGEHPLDNGTLMVLEDLATAGLSPLRQDQGHTHLKAMIRWLAAFHARFMGTAPDGLWEQGCYWHLATRPDEWTAMDSGPLKDAAVAIDNQLQGARYQSLVHGDAKVANFLGSDCGQVAAVDFQYVGGGAGIRDLVYLLGSVLNDDALEAHAFELLDLYCQALIGHLKGRGWSDIQRKQVQEEQLGLFAFAWADFERFLQGWKPGHWKLGRFSKSMTNRALSQL
ncbi:phosphotransferase [Ferrimonas futtsuensis]|uniref:phosphotransferase n=1 Tax=Ferrimonas futtsuensis TaxID=364764 RepID=UPI0004046AE0|nr:phosphotransferase [Ferrimonas futtsuensis]